MITLYIRSLAFECCNIALVIIMISERAKRASSVTVHAPLKFKIYIFVVQAYVGFPYSIHATVLPKIQERNGIGNAPPLGKRGVLRSH